MTRSQEEFKKEQRKIIVSVEDRREVCLFNMAWFCAKLFFDSNSYEGLLLMLMQDYMCVKLNILFRIPLVM